MSPIASSLVRLQQRTGRERLRVLVVAESFLPQVNGVTNSVRRVLEHLAEQGHEAELVAPTGPPSYAGFPVTRTRGASLLFYRDFRLGLESRRRLRHVMLRFQPDVVHVASPATLGHQAVRAANELGLPTVAIYQTDLVGFAERYPVAGGARAMAHLTRRIHGGADRTLVPSDRQPAPARGAAGPGAGALAAGRGPGRLRPRSPVRRGAARRSPRTGGCWSGTSAGWPPRRSSSLLTHLARRARHRPGHRRRWSRGAAAAIPAPRGDVPRGAPRRRAEPGVRGPRRVRAHRAPRDLLPVRAGGAGVRGAGGRAAGGRPGRRRARRSRRVPLRPRGRGPTWRRTSSGSSATRCCAGTCRWPPAGPCATGPGRASTRPWSGTTAT